MSWLKPAAKPLWATAVSSRPRTEEIWKVATSAKEDTGPATREIDEMVLLPGAEDVKASKQFYVGQGLAVAKSFGGKYVEFAADDASAVKLALYKRRGLAKDAGVPVDGTGSHRIVLGGAVGSFTDPDGFAWEAMSPATTLS
ncbi:hypothetical protein GCM10010365_56610 [Streptomyces poonensis]|uniref:Glyoxalase n=1 Tax=Streptomyces poonensis TaxID=68255 RepID=A0A918Q037_9ACTN|nr:glyoxalase [Streptomyces poonensis]GGZ29047.1 hypothetical protein GCM10010365_56610 [Streptomyces poonensis]